MLHRTALADAQSFGLRSENARPKNRSGFGQETIKRCLDIALCLLSLPVILPLILICASMIRLGKGPAFFGQTRIGRNGQSFTCWKLRTMVPDAERVLITYLKNNPHARAEWEAHCKLENDPRITWLGRFLRRTSLDELPQIWNVLKGDMSLVGPRPVPRRELDRYGVFQKHYTSLRPGLTGLWQVSGRNDISYADRIALDTRYALTNNLFDDLRIIARTITVVFQMTGK